VDPTLRAAFHGVAFCHVPADQPIRLEELVTGDAGDDRWNRRGESTVYLATEPAIALAELARHLDLVPDDPPVRRRLLGLSLDVEDLLDLRRPEVRRLLGTAVDVDAFRDREVARAAAERARTEEAACGLLVPSMAFTDDPKRANLVLFIEHLGGQLAPLVRAQHEAGIVELRPAAMRG
jgi:RES domain-containing protein